MGLQDSGLCSGVHEIPYGWYKAVGCSIDVLLDSFKLKSNVFSPKRIIRGMHCNVISGEMLVNSQNIAGDNGFSVLSSIMGK